MRSAFVSIFVLVIAVLDQPAIEAATRVMIGNSTINPRIAPLWIAEEIGYFQTYDIETTLVFVRSTPLLIAAMKSGSIPVAYGGGGGILNASVGESDLKILATLPAR